MADNTPDYSFVRDGLGLDEWLWKLVDESPAERVAAGEALEAMDWGVPSAHTDLSTLTEFPDTEAQGPRFEAEVRRVLATPEFDTKNFVERLGASRIAFNSEWQKKMSALISETNDLGDKYDRMAEELVKRIDSAEDETTRQHFLDRFARLSAVYIRKSCDTQKNPFEDSEPLLSAGFAVSRIFNLLDEELLEAPEVLDLFLSDSELIHEALSALQRIGPAAIAFAPKLLHNLDQFAKSDKSYPSFNGAYALGSIGRDDPHIVSEMIDRLSHSNEAMRISAANVLEEMDGAVCDRAAEICDLLLPKLDRESEYEWFAALSALASVGRDLPHVRQAVLNWAGPRERKPRVHSGVSKLEYDLTMYERGTAISAMRYLSSYPDECIPVLIEAMQSFEEFDPDEGYYGSQSRIATTLSDFGEDAFPAVEPLCRYLDDDDGDSPTAILDLFAGLGPSAYEALPALHNLWKKCGFDVDIASEPIEKMDDHIGWTIQQIQGVPNVE
ncbi:MAG: hypothetical protein KDA93_23940 [Planctomycetaceae bacterium]|nr:hypothetical protein [Planctomycetaceae bacterium]